MCIDILFAWLQIHKKVLANKCKKNVFFFSEKRITDLRIFDQFLQAGKILTGSRQQKVVSLGKMSKNPTPGTPPPSPAVGMEK